MARIRRACRRLWWVLIHGGARGLALLGAWLVRRAVDLELAAERRVPMARAPLVEWRPTPAPLPPPTPPPARRATARTPDHTTFVDFVSASGKGIAVTPSGIGVAVRNGGAC